MQKTLNNHTPGFFPVIDGAGAVDEITSREYRISTHESSQAKA
jgi:hypothetical protein